MKAIQIVKLFIAWLFFILFLSFTESVKRLRPYNAVN